MSISVHKTVIGITSRENIRAFRMHNIEENRKDEPLHSCWWWPKLLILLIFFKATFSDDKQEYFWSIWCTYLPNTALNLSFTIEFFITRLNFVLFNVTFCEMVKTSKEKPIEKYVFSSDTYYVLIPNWITVIFKSGEKKNHVECWFCHILNVCLFVSPPQ